MVIPMPKSCKKPVYITCEEQVPKGDVDCWCMPIKIFEFSLKATVMTFTYDL